MSTELSTGSTPSPGFSPPRVTVRAPAKVNLHLGVGPRRADGYHEVVTVLQAVGLYDELTVTEVEPGEATGDGPAVTATVEISGEGPSFVTRNRWPSSSTSAPRCGTSPSCSTSS